MKPKIRFKGFEGEWKEKPFLDLVQRISTTAQSGKLPAIEYEDIISGEGILNKDIHLKTVRKSGVRFEPGDVLFGKLRPYLKNILLANLTGVAVGDFWVLRSETIIPYILYSIVSSPNFLKVANVSIGSKMPRADWPLVSGMMIKVPSKPEQQAIASYFTHLDVLINSSAARLASLKQVKAASLQAMFPQEGETMPRLRFKGFEGEWKKVKLGDVLQYEQPTPYIVHSTDYLDEGIPVLTAGNSFILGYTNEKFGIYRASKINPTIIFDDFTTSFHLVEFDFKVKSSAMKMLRAKNNDVEFRFIHYAMMMVGYPVVEHSRQWISRFSKLQILCPTLSEQQRIASYFTNLDNQITHQTQRLEKLKQIKAACLNKMFV